MNLRNHICTDSAVNGVKFTAKIIEPKGKANARTLEKLTGINYIVVHNTGNTATASGDEAHATYLQNVENADKDYVSWHVTVDADSATQHLPFDEVGYHAGDGSGPGNRQGIGIEIAENSNYPACEANGIKIICALMHDYGIPIERVQPHRYFATSKKLCPSRILKSQATWEADWKAFQARIASVYNEIYQSKGNGSEGAKGAVDASERGNATDNAEIIWAFFKSKGLNNDAVAGLMGNLFAESGLKPTNLQDTYEKSLGYTDEAYTAAVDSGKYTNFVNDKAGYGLAQWTYWSRKQALLEFAKASGTSIGDLNMQLNFLWKELQGYADVMKVLNSTESVYRVSTAVLTGYEKPANQGIAVKAKRMRYGLDYYYQFANENDKAPSVPDWARDAWDWAKDNGICDGTRPKDSLTREEAVTMIYRLHNIKAGALK